MSGAAGKIEVPAGARVFVHQAFTCCPYAAMITAKIHDYFEQNGCTISDHPEEAAISVINTCGFNASRSEQALRSIRAIRKRAPTSPLVIAGCLTRIERGRVQEALEGVPAWVMIGPGEHGTFDDLLASAVLQFDEVQSNLYKDRYSSGDPRLGLYQVLVSTGCLNTCSYCVIRQAKGTVSSKPIEQVVAEVERGLELGHRDVFLVGDDISSYGGDLGVDVVQLLDRLTRGGGEGRFSAEAFEPSRFIAHLDGLLPVFERDRFSWIVLPAQSGSDRVLEAMNRSYTVADVRDAVARLKQAAPGMIVSTDFIFGFAGETAEEFEASIDLASVFDYANFNDYEPRPGTPDIEIAAEEMERRKAVVNALLRKQGGQVQVLTRNRSVVCDWWKDGDSPMVGRRAPTRWAVESARRLETMVEAGGAALASGWSVTRLKADLDRVMLLATHEDRDDVMEFMVVRRDEKAPCMAFSDDYNLTLVSDEAVDRPDEERMAALDALVDLLGMRC
ncbi:MAG: radical SAM protein [Deltaproteobacteria bacterium]|nr:radical SAM protein [Deltaproteobacteria bacterium]